MTITLSRRALIVIAASAFVVLTLVGLLVARGGNTQGGDDERKAAARITAPDLGPNRGSQDGGGQDGGPAVDGLGGGGVSNTAAIEWARGQTGSDAWAGWCLRFVANAYGMEAAGIYDAISAAHQLELHDEPAASAPVGSLLFFEVHESNWGHGHVGLSLGDGSMISATATVRVDDVADPYWASLYLGWAYPPDTWSPQIQDEPQPSTTVTTSTVPPTTSTTVAPTTTTVVQTTVATTTTPPTYREQCVSSSGCPTFKNPENASGQGERIPSNAVVDITCKYLPPSTVDTAKPDGYWYKVASSPWSNTYWAVANSFHNGGDGTSPTNWSIRDC